MTQNWRDSAAGFAALADSRNGLVLAAATLQLEAFQWLSNEGLVERGKGLSSLNCSACRMDHEIEEDDAGQYMVCAQGVERLAPEKVTRWRCDLMKLGRFLNEAGQLNGRPKAVIADMLLELGLLGKVQNSHFVLLSRSMGHPETRKTIIERLEDRINY